ncbi:MAG: serine hydrolase domain-containing protein [Anaerolineae bacterium]
MGPEARGGTPISTPLPAVLGQLIEQRMAELHVPGMAVGIIHGDEEQVACFGITNVEHPLAVDVDTLLQVGSITKTVTATVAMRLTEAGDLDLDAPVRTYLPSLRLADADVAARVTMRHLLTHTAGWEGDYFDDFGNGDDALARMVEQLARLPQIVPLGRYWSYNNAGFYLAGRVVEVVVGKPYEDLAKEMVLAPLGMSMSFFFPGDCITHRVACGHEAIFEQTEAPPVVVRPWAAPRCAAPMGGLVSTLRDQLRYARFHMGDGTAATSARLLAAESIACMQRPQVAAAENALCGMPWSIRDVQGVRVVSHAGGTRGQQALLLLAPARHFALSALSNSGRGLELIATIRDWVLEHYLGVEPEEPQAMAASPQQLAPFAGRYHLTVQDLCLTLEGDQLMLHWQAHSGWPTPTSQPPPPPPPARVTLCGEDRLLVLDEPAKGSSGEFLRRPDGSIGWLRFGGRMYVRLPDAE